MDPTGIMAALAGGGEDAQQYGQGADPVDMLRTCITDLHQLQAAMPDAQHVQLVHQAMAPLLKIQQELAQSQNQSQDPRQALIASLNQPQQ